MKFDRDWMREHLDWAGDADQVADGLTNCGLLVELREPTGSSEVWDVDVTSNRPDAMNHRGLAREAAAALGSRLRPVEFLLEEAAEVAADRAEVEILDPDLCGRYCARVITGVKVQASPSWLKDRLERCSVRPINAVVDATNYVLLELGQPLHAFDLELVQDQKIVVRRAKEGEKLTTLDGVERTLEPDMLVIADGGRAVALAGIMGGGDSEIHAGTTTVLLESAHFEALSVRRTARKLGMHTEASHRFERGTDPQMAGFAADRAAALIAQLTGGTVLSGRIDRYPEPYEAPIVEFSHRELCAFTGLDIDPERTQTMLTALELAPVTDGDLVVCSVPSHRVDIERAADLYEEVIRHVGYNTVPSVLPPTAKGPGRRSANWRLVDRARLAAVAAGLYEVMTYSFIDPAQDELAGQSVLCLGEALPLDNPLAKTQGVMRRSLLPGILAAAKESLSHGESSLTLFEQGKAFALADDGPVEADRLVVAMAGEGVTFAHLKGVVERILEDTGFPSHSWRRGGGPWLDEAQGALIETEDGAVIGAAGLLSSAMAGAWDLRLPLYVVELDLTKALEDPPMPRFEALPRYPAVTEDMTVEHQHDLPFATIAEAIRSLAGDHVEKVDLVDRYEGEKLPSGVIRTTLRVIYRHPDRSLTQDEVNRDHEALRSQLAERLGVRLV